MEHNRSGTTDRMADCLVACFVAGLAGCSGGDTTTIDGAGGWEAPGVASARLTADANNEDTLAAMLPGDTPPVSAAVRSGADGVGPHTVSDESTRDGESDLAYPPEWWGPPITAPSNKWTWIPFPESECADGTPSGLGVNLSPGADKVLLYLEGGGACWNYSNCAAAIPSAFHMNGYDERTFNGFIAAIYKAMPIFDRNEPQNPLASAHYVFVPYCTADAFSGDNDVELKGKFPWEKKTIHFRGHRNLEAFLSRLVPTFQGARKVILSGASAGAIGSALNWSYIQQKFGNIRVDLLDDSGPPIRVSDELWQAWRDTWNMQFPPGCSDCEQGVDSIIRHIRRTLLNTNRFGLASYSHDSVISAFFGITPSVFQERLDAVTQFFDQEPNAQYFVLSGITHTTMMFGYENIKSKDGFPMWRWVEQMVDDDPDWTSHKP